MALSCKSLLGHIFVFVIVVLCLFVAMRSRNGLDDVLPLINVNIIIKKSSNDYKH